MINRERKREGRPDVGVANKITKILCFGSSAAVCCLCRVDSVSQGATLGLLTRELIRYLHRRNSTEGSNPSSAW